MGSFLAVFKKFGNVPSPGILSFPEPGYTLALDFANAGTKTEKLFSSLDRIIEEAGGRLYPAKDSKMSANQFMSYYPKFEQFKKWIDPKFSSSFLRRVTTYD
jgi:FAD/FMN-containing dehydrogenase